MKKLITLAVVALLSTNAFATNNGDGGCQGNCPTSTGGTQEQAQGQLQGQAQGQLQGQAQGNINVVDIDVKNRVSNDVRTSAVAFAGSTSDATSNSKSSAVGGASTSTANGGNSSSGGNVSTNSVTVTDSGRMRYSGEIRNVPNVVVGNTYPTAPCMGSSNAGGSGVGFGIAFGTSWTDDECSKREAARSFASIGLVEDAVAILCSTNAAAVAPSCAVKSTEK